MTLQDRVAKLERAPKPQEWGEPPKAKTMEEWLARRDLPPPPPPPPGALVRGYINAPPKAKSIEEWCQWVAEDRERGR